MARTPGSLAESAAGRLRTQVPPSAADVLNAVSVPMLTLDRSGAPVMANPAAETLLGRSQETLLDRGWEGLLPPDSPVRAIIAESAAAAKPISAYDLGVELMGRPAFTADALVAPVGAPGGWSTLAFQQRSVAGMMERLAEQRGAVRSASALGAMLAHEIKNPLSGIRGAAQLLGGEDRDELSRLIIAEVDRISALIDSLERFTDTRAPPMQAVNIHAILGHVRTLAQAGDAKGIAIRETYDPSLPDVAGDRDGLVQVFLNLVKNAAEAAGPEGAIEISTAYRQGLKIGTARGDGQIAVPIEICVTDNGPGAPPELSRNMFDAFVSSKMGTGGLGLALVAKIVADHRGHVEYERDSKKGLTIMRVLLPRSAQ